jgi:hypothetical protein
MPWDGRPAASDALGLTAELQSAVVYSERVPTTIDEALALLAESGPEFAAGKMRLSNHGPMAAEALIALGRDRELIPWVEGYKRRLEGRPEARNPIAPDEWREALGDITRVGDWATFFEGELASAPWPDVLELWTRRLAPGIVAAATHGVIRTAHAVRSLADEETPLRLHELAEGLAYWAATYMLLPGAPSSSSRGLRPSQAVRAMATFPPEEQRNFGTITSMLRKLDDVPSFAEAIDLVDVGEDPADFLSELTETFAGVYLANARGGNVIGLIHAVTGPGAVRLLAPHLSSETVALALRYAWQAAAGLYVTMAQTPVPEAIEPPAGDIEDLIDRAVATGDEHAIKFTEACLREQALHPQPVYLAAALDASTRLNRRG